MKFCKFCFDDEEVQNLIINLLHSAGEGQCECCGKNNVVLYDTGKAEDLAESFADILEIFKEAKDGKKGDLISILKHWNIFRSSVNDVQALKLLKELNQDIFRQSKYLENGFLTISELEDKDFLRRNSILGSANWDEFKENILYKNRYHPIDRESYVGEDTVANIFSNMEMVIEKGKTLWRARISDDTGFLPSEMGVPPFEKRTDGRTSARGEECLYLADSEETAIKEVRAGLHDFVTVGEFKVKEDIKVVDLTMVNRLSPFMENMSVLSFAANIDILRHFEQELLKPMRRMDDNFSYIPTQYLVDTIKKLGYVGVVYSSVMNKDGTNFALFDEKLFCCEGMKIRF